MVMIPISNSNSNENKKWLPTKTPQMVVCTGVFPIGKYWRKTPDGNKLSEYIFIMFECAELDDKGKHKTAGIRQVWSNHEKSNFGKIVTNWTGTVIDAGFDAETLRGRAGLATISTKSGYANVVNMMEVPEGMPVFEPDNMYIGEECPDFIKTMRAKSVKQEPREPKDIEPNGNVATDDDMPF